MFERDDYDDRFATPAEAVTEWRYAVGATDPECEWLLSDYDTWEKNPYYRGKPGPHPEDPPPPEDGVECLGFNFLEVGYHRSKLPPWCPEPGAELFGFNVWQAASYSLKSVSDDDIPF